MNAFRQASLRLAVAAGGAAVASGHIQTARTERFDDAKAFGSDEPSSFPAATTQEPALMLATSVASAPPLGTTTAAASTAATLSQQRNDTKKSSTVVNVDLDKVRDTIRDVVAVDAEARGDGTSLAGTMLRLTFVSSTALLERRKAAVSCEHHGGEPHLEHTASDDSFHMDPGLVLVRKVLEPVKSKFPEMSYADLYAYAGVVAIEMSGGPNIPFRLGRNDDMLAETTGSSSVVTCSSCQDKVKETKGFSDVAASIKRWRSAADRGSPMQMVEYLRKIIAVRYGLTDAEMVALMGAHTLGRCHIERTGYWGPWSPSETNFSNDYFTLLLQEWWSNKRTHNGHVWVGPTQYSNLNSQTVDGVTFGGGSVVRLPVDLALLTDPELHKWVASYAKDQDLFFKNFARAFSKIINAGARAPAPPPEPWYCFW